MNPKAGRGGRSRFRSATLAVAAISLFWCGLGPLPGEIAARPDESTADAAEKLVKEQLKLALETIDRIGKMREIGAPVNLSIAEYYLWSRRVLETKLFLSLGRDEKAQDVEVYLRNARGGPVAERIGFFEEHVNRMRYVEAQNRILVQKQQISALDFSNVEYNRRQAEIWLAREKGRSSGSK